MGNAGSNLPRERHKSGSHDPIPGSPLKDGQAFVFDKKPDPNHRLVYQRSDEDAEPYYSKSVPEPEFVRDYRKRANTISDDASMGVGGSGGQGIEPEEDDKEEQKTALPTVFKWEGGGKQVYISGTFSEWKALPMVKSHGDFVTIIDLPEGDHQYKFCVDGEWKHDPRLVRWMTESGGCSDSISNVPFYFLPEKCRKRSWNQEQPGVGSPVGFRGFPSTCQRQRGHR